MPLALPPFRLSHRTTFLIPVPKTKLKAGKTMPFDGTRMIYGGFKSFLEA